MCTGILAQDYKTISMLTSAGHEISSGNKYKKYQQ